MHRLEQCPLMRAFFIENKFSNGLDLY